MSNAISLVDYLIKLSDLGREPIRNVDKFERTLWMHEVPIDLSGFCYTVAHGIESDHEDDIWMFVKKCNEPRVPFIPSECREWVIAESLKNHEIVPSLKESIHSKIHPITSQEHDEPSTYYLLDYPEIETIWHAYIENDWSVWRDDYRKFSRILKVYSELFDIHQELLKLGEEYELLVGIGLLNWKTPSEQAVRRHLITARVSLEFEAHRGVFTVKPANESNILNIEFDMLDVQDQPNNVREMEVEARKHIGESVWHRAVMEPVLTSFVNQLPSHGKGELYWETIKPEISKADETPRVEFAPALILRKRSEKGLQNILRKMRDSVVDDIKNIPDSFLELCEIRGDANNVGNTGFSGGFSGLPPEEIYFPLPTNEEQRQIVRTLTRSRGALVQGPPGTGKSHTIANLICHLLATGNRILVTAKTPRALQVLHSKLPKDIQPLCISMLASGQEEKQSLETSVKGIQARIQQGDTDRNDEEIELLENKIRTAREEKARIENLLRAIREKATYTHNIADGRYKGTAGVIARSVAADAVKYSWFDDIVSENAPFPLSEQEIRKLSDILYQLKPESELLLEKKLPETDNIPDPEILRGLFDQEEILKNNIEADDAILNSEISRLLKSSAVEQVKSLKDELLEFVASHGKVQNRPFTWIKTAVQEVIADVDRPWREHLKHCQERLDKIRSLSRQIQDVSVTIPGDLDTNWLLDGAKALRQHFANGGGMGFGPFKASIIKEYHELISKIRVNGRQCTNEETLGKLTDYLTVALALDSVWKFWANHLPKSNAPFPLQVAFLDEQNEALEEVISLYEKRQRVMSAVQTVAGLVSPRFEDDSEVKFLLRTSEAVLKWHSYKDLANRISAVEANISVFSDHQTYHPLCAQLYNAYEKRDTEQYGLILKLIDDLRAETALACERQRLFAILAPISPLFIEKLKAIDTKNIYRDHLQHLHAAWDCSRTKQWIKDMLSADVESLGRYLIQLEDETHKDIAKLASLKAWKACLKRMSKKHQQHLTEWQKAMDTPGMREGGVRAMEKRRNAQFQLEQCIDAVPGWIMPLHRVYDTIDPSPGLFDTIIVDEASQCGIEALPLFFLGKNILIVGDDKQISPEASFIKQAPIQNHMDTYLAGFNFAASFDVTRSLYDHAERLFVSNRIVLREHFRCMPEIIGFSNKYFYQVAPMIPLKQYLPDRLEPVKSVHVSSGYREGDGQKVINRPEAEALVRQLVICCGDERYNGKTFGVIVLQGGTQANIIQQLLLKELGAEKIEKRKIICGNAYSFQGDERDIIFLSMVAAPNANIGTLSDRADQRRFNVAASRAKEQMWLFHSATLNDLSPICLRYKLLEYFTNGGQLPPNTIDVDALRLRSIRDNRAIVQSPSPFDSWFEVDVFLEIAARGYQVIPQYEVAKKRIDLVVQGKTAQLAVECDGDAWHGPEQYDKDMYRQRMLERCGWQFVRIRECLFYAAKDDSLQPLWDKIQELNIAPFTPQTADEQPSDNFYDNDNSGPEKFDEEERQNIRNNEENDDEIDSTENGTEATESFTINTGGIVPDNIHHALVLKKEEIEELIIEILQARPKTSCIKDKMAIYILQSWKIRSWGAPKQEFSKKVDKILTSMARKGYVVIYKSKNIRIKLGQKRYERQRVLL